MHDVLDMDRSNATFGSLTTLRKTVKDVGALLFQGDERT